jgi:hypothetical protein
MTRQDVSVVLAKLIVVPFVVDGLTNRSISSCFAVIEWQRFSVNDVFYMFLSVSPA